MRGRISAAAEAVVGEEIRGGERGIWARRLPVGDGLACILAGSGVGRIVSGEVSVAGCPDELDVG